VVKCNGTRGPTLHPIYVCVCICVYICLNKEKVNKKGKLLKVGQEEGEGMT
jgi:hypothetical protein